MRRVAALLGFVLKVEVDAIFQQQPFETEGGADPLQLWRHFDYKRQQLSPLAPAPEVESLPESLNPLIEEIKGRKIYKEHYEAAADYSFVLTPIDSLLSPQWHADLDYIDEITSRLHTGMTSEEQLLFAMSEGKITEPIVTGTQVSSQARGVISMQIRFQLSEKLRAENSRLSFVLRVAQTTSRP